MKRGLSAAIAAAILWSVTSCAGNTAPAINTTEAGTDIQAVTGQESTEISDGLPQKDYEGRDFNFFCRTAQLYEFNVREQMGEVVNDAVYARNKAVEDRFNISIKTIDMDGSWANMSAYKNTIKNSVLSGDGAYDLVEGDTAIVDLLGHGYFENLLELPNIDASKPWWSQASVKTLNIGGTLEFICGDLSMLLWEGLCVVFFNKQLVSDYSIENPYQLVLDGKWTIDAVQKISKDIYKDLNGNGENDKEDLYGLITTSGNMIDNFFISSDLPLTVSDQDGYPALNSLTDDRAVSVTQKVFDFIVNSPGVFVEDEQKTEEVHEVMFMGDRGVFYTALLKSAQAFRTMDTDFGILPYPKYEEAQEKYETFSKGGYSAFAIPSTAKDAEFSSIILEALCAESYKKVVPAFYDVALKSKYSRDDDSAVMLDIIREGFDFDFACVALDYTDWILLSLRNMVGAKSYDWVSRMEKSQDKIDKLLAGLKQSIQDGAP